MTKRDILKVEIDIAAAGGFDGIEDAMLSVLASCVTFGVEHFRWNPDDFPERYKIKNDAGELVAFAILMKENQS